MPQKLKENRAAGSAHRRQPYHQRGFLQILTALPELDVAKPRTLPVLLGGASLGVDSFLGISPSFGLHLYVSGTSGHNVFNCLGEGCSYLGLSNSTVSGWPEIGGFVEFDKHLSSDDIKV